MLMKKKKKKLPDADPSPKLILNESRTPPFPMEESIVDVKEDAPEVWLCRSAPSAHAAQYYSAFEGGLRGSPKR